MYRNLVRGEIERERELFRVHVLNRFSLVCVYLLVECLYLASSSPWKEEWRMLMLSVGVMMLRASRETLGQTDTNNDAPSFRRPRRRSPAPARGAMMTHHDRHNVKRHNFVS